MRALNLLKVEKSKFVATFQETGIVAALNDREDKNHEKVQEETKE